MAKKKMAFEEATNLGCATVFIVFILFIYISSKFITTSSDKTKNVESSTDTSRPDAIFICREAIKTASEFDVKIDFLPYMVTTEPVAYTNTEGKPSYKHILKYNVKFQNAYGAYRTAMCHCGVDSNKLTLVDFECY